jgi:hypothetical protein
MEGGGEGRPGTIQRRCRSRCPGEDLGPGRAQDPSQAEPPPWPVRTCRVRGGDETTTDRSTHRDRRRQRSARPAAGPVGQARRRLDRPNGRHASTQPANGLSTTTAHRAGNPTMPAGQGEMTAQRPLAARPMATPRRQGGWPGHAVSPTARRRPDDPQQTTPNRRPPTDDSPRPPAATQCGRPGQSQPSQSETTAQRSTRHNPTATTQTDPARPPSPNRDQPDDRPTDDSPRSPAATQSGDQTKANRAKARRPPNGRPTSITGSNTARPTRPKPIEPRRHDRSTDDSPRSPAPAQRKRPGQVRPSRGDTTTNGQLSATAPAGTGPADRPNRLAKTKGGGEVAARRPFNGQVSATARRVGVSVGPVRPLVALGLSPRRGCRRRGPGTRRTCRPGLRCGRPACAVRNVRPGGVRRHPRGCLCRCRGP